MKEKYAISREFFPLNLFTPPMSLPAIKASQKMMGVPAFLGRDSNLCVQSFTVPAYQNGEIEVLFLTPKNTPRPAPCLLYIHGGGFVFDAAPYQYRHATMYAKGASCAVAFVRYRLAPDYPFPFPQEDCYCAATWLVAHAEELGVDPLRIGIAGDSAGGMLTATTCMMLRDRGNAVQPLFQLLIYPWLDTRNNSNSNKRFVDVPMWNSTLSKKVEPIINPNPDATPLAYRSPVEAQNFTGLPPAYIEVAEFDCLHDDGILYADRLRAQGIRVELHETHGTIHAFDSKLSAPTTKEMLAKRIDFMSLMFNKS